MAVAAVAVVAFAAVVVDVVVAVVVAREPTRVLLISLFFNLMAALTLVASCHNMAPTK